MSHLMLDIASYQATKQELAQLTHPQIGGVILFSRNYRDKTQLCQLVKSLRSVKKELLIAVDHEGGRVQRFRDEFTHLPAMGAILPAAQGDIELAKKWAAELGFLMAVELLACDIDLSFAPVLDLNRVSQVIGDRAFSDEPQLVIPLADAFIKGMNQAGMSAVGKHFPGHGSVVADSHLDVTIDEREVSEIIATDMQPFKELIIGDALQGVMPAHVIYSKVDPQPAGFSTYWLQTILKQQLAFKGVIFSDDLGMKGAGVAGSYTARAEAALKAGCDMILVCNDPVAATEVLQGVKWPDDLSGIKDKIAQLKPAQEQVQLALEDQSRWLKAQAIAEKILAS